MIEPGDPLESELREFRPAATSPALRRGVADRLAIRRRRLRRVALAGGLAAAAGMIAAILVLAPRSGPVGGRIPGVAGPDGSAPAPAPDGDAMPSLRAYRRALARSAGDLDALLARHAGLGLGRGRDIVRVRDLRRPVGDGQILPGEP
ncbi:hypothetical protein OJF2_44280 [Aquisphaera giovannonii]|uniref:Uncharacterized protein n=1 Tax=Aquisphaera giovannonii TaxID=406548 RepID=A0A5B9W780_9BACT|nr:hypothetical protein [Aquisphaera giovannonii]QEH35871.1 hypothetical protein OJF2_44280 [Aquisphaera giovannonii]